MVNRTEIINPLNHRLIQHEFYDSVVCMAPCACLHSQLCLGMLLISWQLVPWGRGVAIMSEVRGRDCYGVK